MKTLGDSFIKDDMLFIPYMNDGWQCKIKILVGEISVRFGGYGLLTDSLMPYEVFYPTEDAPIGYQVADDIWDYIKINSCKK